MFARHHENGTAQKNSTTHRASDNAGAVPLSQRFSRVNVEGEAWNLTCAGSHNRIDPLDQLALPAIQGAMPRFQCIQNAANLVPVSQFGTAERQVELRLYLRRIILRSRSASIHPLRSSKVQCPVCASLSVGIVIRFHKELRRRKAPSGSFRGGLALTFMRDIFVIPYSTAGQFKD